MMNLKSDSKDIYIVTKKIKIIKQTLFYWTLYLSTNPKNKCVMVSTKILQISTLIIIHSKCLDQQIGILEFLMFLLYF